MYYLSCVSFVYPCIFSRGCLSITCRTCNVMIFIMLELYTLYNQLCCSNINILIISITPLYVHNKNRVLYTRPCNI